MYSPCTIEKKPRAYLIGKDKSKLAFERSINRFGRVEEDGLRIRIINEDSFSDAMGVEEATDPPSSVADLYLDKFGPSQIREFDPDDHPKMNDAVCSFLIKLRILAMNDIQPTEVLREELRVSNMTADLMRSVKFDGSRELTMAPCILGLSIGSKEFTAKAEREVTRGTGIILIMQVNKRITNEWYKSGDIQLASCMIAAYQENAMSAEQAKVYPERMMGIKIRRDVFHFYSMRMTASYLEDLTCGIPNDDVKVFKYPGEIGLSLFVPRDRRQILNHLWSMRCYAAGLEKIKGD